MSGRAVVRRKSNVTVQHLRLGMLRIPRCGWSEAFRALTTHEIRVIISQ